MKLQPVRLRLINMLLLVLIVCVGFFTFLSWIDARPVSLPEPLPPQKFTLPLSFKAPQQALDKVGHPFITLAKNDIKLQLPDLRNTLIYFGSTVRPDVSESAVIVQMGLRGSNVPQPVQVGSPIYLKYESKGNAGKWFFSPNNTPTSIWIDIKPQEGSCVVHVHMTDGDGNKIVDPRDFSEFTLTQVHLPYTAQGTNAFEIGGLRADSSILIRQKCAWFGQDLFLQELGDESTRYAFEKERLDFLDPDNLYSCFVGVGDCLAYIDNQWIEVEPGPDSRNRPLLVVKKVDDKTISFDLWDPKGKVRVPIELRKAMPMPAFANKLDLKLVGARSKRDWIAELGGVRMLVRADDWLILQDNAWHKISTPEELDDFVEGNIRGPLLVLEGSEKVGNDMSLIGKLYDITRTQVVPLKISLFKSWEQAAPSEAKATDKDSDDEDEDSEDDDDDEEDDDDEDDDDEDEDPV